MPKKKKALKYEDTVTNSGLPEGVTVVFEQPIQPLELSGGLTVTREEFNQVVGKLNEVIKKVK